MDGTRFDALAKLLAGPASRRSAIRSLSGGAFGAVLGLLGLAEAEAGDKKKKKKKKKRRCPEDAVDCGGGSCVGPGQCCPGEKRCGGGCIAGTSCCPYTEIECPNGSCVSIIDGCCSEAECGDCGTCLNGRCVEVPGICDTADCQRCIRFSWTCESRCRPEATCCGGECCDVDQCYDCSGGGQCTYRCGTNCCFRNTCLGTPCGG